MITPRGILRKYGIRPVKGLGQSFLIDNNINAKIVSVSDFTDADIVVEIGAGLGVMTAMVAACARKVIALEVDPRLLTVLRKELEDIQNIQILEQDVLTYDFSRAGEEQRFPAGGVPKVKVIGNIPYNISSQILLRVLEFRESITSMTLMFQREVAERIVASPGTREYGMLSVMASRYTVPSKVLSVPATCFYPRPKVDSAVVKMTVREEPLGDVRDDDFFFAVVKAAFSKRRKTLSNNLKSSDLLGPYDVDIVKILRAAEIDGQRRGETLTVEEFAKLANEILSEVAPR